MSYKSSSRQFDGVVYASDIKPCDYLLDYINGKGQFYVENSYYPVVKYVYDEKNKRPFVEDDFKTDGGINVKTPRICFKYGGNFQRYFSIVWNTNTASNNKQFFCLNAYMGWDEKNKKPLKLKPTDGKVRPFEIQISSQTDLKFLSISLFLILIMQYPKKKTPIKTAIMLSTKEGISSRI